MIYFESIGDFFAMGGHGFYVWLSYGMVVFALVLQFFLAKSSIQRAATSLNKYFIRQDEQQKNAPENKNNQQGAN